MPDLMRPILVYALDEVEDLSVVLSGWWASVNEQRFEVFETVCCCSDWNSRLKFWNGVLMQ